MASRNFNWAFALIAVVFVIAPGGEAAAQFGGMPKTHFDDTPRPPAPDYADPATWAALPDRPDLADLAPAGTAVSDNQDTADVDVFYIHPTTYRGGENWNQDLGMVEVNEWTDTSVIARQASAFNGCCRIFAPRYRQATISALGGAELGGLKAYDFAYQDVLSAWQHYLETWNNGRPFILVGHSQGALHAQTLLKNEISGTPLADRIVAAYVIGIAIPEGWVERSLQDIPVCRSATDTGCFISWNTFDHDGDPSRGVGIAQSRYRDEFGTSEGQNIVCWSPTSRAEGDNSGALPGNPTHTTLTGLVPGYGAECRNGTLWTTTPKGEEFQLTLFAGGNLHMHDMDLFYEDIRMNAVERVEAFLAQ